MFFGLMIPVILLFSLLVIPLVFVYGFDTKRVYSILRNIIIGLSISLLFPLTTYIGLTAFWPQPQRPEMTSKDWELGRKINRARSLGAYDQVSELQKQVREDVRKYNEDYDAWMNKSIYLSFIVGFLAILAGAFLRIGFLSAGYIFGGILTIISGMVFNWTRFTEPIKFGILISSLLLVIALGYWFFWRGKLKK